MTRSIAIVGITLMLMLGMTVPVSAQMHLGVQGDFGSDTDWGIGVRLAYDFEKLFPGFEAVGSFDWFFPDLVIDEVDYNYFELNGNVTCAISLLSIPSLSPYFGGGINIAHGNLEGNSSDVSVNVSDTQYGWNIVGGTKFNMTRLKPYVELRLELSGGEQFVLTGGFLF